MVESHKVLSAACSLVLGPSRSWTFCVIAVSAFPHCQNPMLATMYISEIKKSKDNRYLSISWWKISSGMPEGAKTAGVTEKL